MLHLSKYLDKLGRISLPLVLTLVLAGCGASDAGDHMPLTTLEEYGVAPLDLTERDQQLLEALPFAGYDQIMLAEFYAPDDATTFSMESWYLDQTGEWQRNVNHKIDLVDISNPHEVGRGILSLYWADGTGLAPELYMSMRGSGGSSKSWGEAWGIPDNAPVDGLATMSEFLQQPTEIVLGEPVPLGIITGHDINTGQQVFSVNDFFNTEKFADSLYTFAVTVTFLDDRGEDQVNIVHPDEN